MDEKNISVIILAAGKGTRMGEGIPKVIRPLAGEPILVWTLKTLSNVGFKTPIIVLGENALQVEAVLESHKENYVIALQKRLLGTAHGLKCGLKKVDPKAKYVLVLFGDDSALYSAQTIREFVERAVADRAKVLFLTSMMDQISDIGGLEKDGNGNVIGVLTRSMMESRNITNHEILCGAFVFDYQWIMKNIGKIKKNPRSGEYPLPGIIQIANKQNVSIKTYVLKDKREWNSVNTQEELKEAESKKISLLYEN